MESRDLALCLVGQLRGICRSADFASLFDVFLSNFASVDAFLVFPQSTCATDVELFLEGSLGRHDDIRIHQVCQSDDLDDRAEVKTYRFFNDNDWWRKSWHNMTMLLNMMIYAKHIATCGAEIAKRVDETNYHYVARVRPDVHWYSFMRRAELDEVVPSVVLLNFVAMPIQGVVEDAFAIGRWEDMTAYFGFHTEQILDIARLNSINMPWCFVHATRRSTSFCGTVWPENLLEEHMRRHRGIQLQKRRSICFERVYPCMQERTHYCRSTTRNHRGFLQSNLQDYLQLDGDFFQTALADYAAYDSVLASRLAHFLMQEAARLRHAPRVLDLGCGRCSYVEAFSSWGFPALGVDGNSVIARSLPRQSIRWDLTQQFDIQRAFSLGTCDYTLYEIGSPSLLELARTYSANDGDAKVRLEVFIEVPRLTQSTFWQDGELIGDVAFDLLRTLCCADIRCAGYAIQETNGILLAWNRAVDDGEASFDANPVPMFVRRVSKPRILLNPKSESLLEDHASFDFDTQYSSLDFSFSIADWVLSLGVGAEVPRMGERVFVENIARHAAEGVIISWGDVGPNIRSQEEVLSLFLPYGLIIDKETTDDVKFFAGLSHAGDRDDLLVLRRSHAFNVKKAIEVKVIEDWGRHPCQVGVNFGQLGVGRMWAGGGCAGSFSMEGHEGISFVTLCIGGYPKLWRECVFHTSQHPTLDTPVEELRWRAEPSPGQFRIDAIVASDLYDSSDHMVPELGVWSGNPRLNLVFFKIARAVASPKRAGRLGVAWNWFWTTSWYDLISRPPLSSEGSAVVQHNFVMWQIGRVCLAWQQLACRMRADSSFSSFGKAIASDISNTVGWQSVMDALDSVDNLVMGCFQNSFASSHCSSREELWKTVDLIRKDIAQKVLLLSPIEALHFLHDLVETVLPRMWEISSALDFSSGVAPTAGLVYKGRGCQDDVWNPRSNVANFWAKDTVVGWYLYRLAALDPEM